MVVSPFEGKSEAPYGGLEIWEEGAARTQVSPKAQRALRGQHPLSTIQWGAEIAPKPRRCVY